MNPYKALSRAGRPLVQQAKRGRATRACYSPGLNPPSEQPLRPPPCSEGPGKAALPPRMQSNIYHVSPLEEARDRNHGREGTPNHDPARRRDKCLIPPSSRRKGCK